MTFHSIFTRPPRALVAAVLAVGVLTGVGAAPAAATTIQRVVSPGGIEAWLVEEHTVPLIALNFAFKGGSSQDPDGKEGVANLVSTLMDEGAGDMTGQQFQTALDDISAEMSFEDGRDRFYGQMKMMAETKDKAFDLLALSLNKPRFDADAIERMRRQAIAGARRELKDPDAVAGHLFGRTVFGNHPYGRLSSGSEQSIQAITADDVRSFHRNTFARDGLKVAVVGAIDAKTLAPLLDKLFAGLPDKGSLKEVPEAKLALGATVADTMAIPQATVRFGTEGLKRRDADFQAAYVMNHILGGGTFSSWLYTEVREKRGLAYTISTGLAPFEHAGLFVGGVGTRADKVGETIGIIKEQLKRMAEQGPTQEELDKAKEYIIGSYALRFDTSDKIAGQLLAIQIDDLGIDYIDKRNDQISAVTLADVKRVAKRILSNPVTFVTVGPSAS